MKITRAVAAAPRLRTKVRRRRRLSWLEAFGLLAGVSTVAVIASAALITLTDPARYPDFAHGLWWAVTTITTVGYGDIVPASPAGRLLAAGLMFTGIASLAFLTAIATSAIVVGEVGEEEQMIEDETRDIHRLQMAILATMRSIDARLAALEEHRPQQEGGEADDRQ